jgi:hypothetical protein
VPIEPILKYQKFIPTTGTLKDLATKAICEEPIADITYPFASNACAPRITFVTLFITNEIPLIRTYVQFISCLTSFSSKLFPLSFGLESTIITRMLGNFLDACISTLVTREEYPYTSKQSSFVIFDLEYDVPEITMSLLASMYLHIVSPASKIFSSMNFSISSFKIDLAFKVKINQYYEFDRDYLSFL